MNSFNNDQYGQGAKLLKKELRAVISRHPYDIAGMSTDRFWDGNLYVLQSIQNSILNSSHIPKQIRNIKNLYKYLEMDDLKLLNKFGYDSIQQWQDYSKQQFLMSIKDKLNQSKQLIKGNLK